MKEIYSEELEFITPAFLCGADQSRAEIRPASIRGQLRWWFRVLGGTREQENEVFGSVNPQTASKVVVRVSEVKAKHEPFDVPRPMSDRGYIYYFATVSGAHKGQRIEPHAYFAAGTRFCLTVLLRSEPAKADRELLDLAIDSFVHLGALGLRATRGCGALAVVGEKFGDTAFEALKTKLDSEDVLVDKLDDDFPTAMKAQERLGGRLRELRRETHNSGKGITVLGGSVGNNRQASALHLRPIRMADGRYRAAYVYTDKVHDIPHASIGAYL